MKHEWRKVERSIYLRSKKPILTDVPDFHYLMFNGRGNPNDVHFTKCVEALYGISYAIRMSWEAQYAIAACRDLAL